MGRRALHLSCVSVLSAGLVLTGGDASATESPRAGWWSSVGAGSVLLGNPTTAPDDLHVGQGVAGPTAYAAVSYTVESGVSESVLELVLTPGQRVGSAQLRACPTTSVVWEESRGGAAAAGPTYDCSTEEVAGIVSADGLQVSFLLGAPRENVYSLAIVPTEEATPFQLDLERPSAEMLFASGSASEPDPAPAPPPSEEVPPPPSTQNPPEAFTLPEGVSVPGVVVAPPAASQQPPRVAPAPVLAPPVQPVAAPRPASPPGLDPARVVAAVMLVGLMGLALNLAQQPAAAPRLLGGAAHLRPASTVVAGPVRGVGRFASPRTGPPRRL